MPRSQWPNRSFLDLAHVDLPIVQAAIGWAAGPDLAAAVSNAGGLGILGLSGSPADQARAAIQRTRALTDKPFGVNLVLQWPQDDVFPMLLEEAVPIFSFFWGDCSRFVEPAHRNGAIVMHTVGSVEEALNAVRWGVDVIVAQGWEAGGHVRGTTSTMALVPSVVDAVGTVPVIAAGGIADGRGVAAAFALGAAGVWVGTRYLAATEAPIHPHYRRRILAAREGDTLYSTNFYDGGWPDAPHRMLKNSLTDIWEQEGRPANGQRHREGQVVGSNSSGAILAYSSLTPTTKMQGDIEAMSLWAGQGVGLVNIEESAADITIGMAEQALRIFENQHRRE